MQSICPLHWHINVTHHHLRGALWPYLAIAPLNTSSSSQQKLPSEGWKEGRTFSLNTVGVPQRSAISPSLFNHISRSSPILRANEGLTLYADITIWTTGGSLADQEYTYQKAMEPTARFLKEAGEKTNYFISKRMALQHIDSLNLSFTINDQATNRKSLMHILGRPIDEDGKATTWMEQTALSWRQTTHIICSTTMKTWGAREAALTSRLGLIRCLSPSCCTKYTSWLSTKDSALKWKISNKEAMWLVTGLPHYAQVLAVCSTYGSAMNGTPVTSARELAFVVGSGSDHNINGLSLKNKTTTWHSN